MSSIPAFSGSTIIEYLGPDRYRVVDERPRGSDGVAGGDTLGKEPGTVVNENAVNQLLALRGMRAVGGELRSVDGFALGSGNVEAVSCFGGAPPLPEVVGPTIAPSVLSSRLDWAQSSEAISDGALMWMALSTLAQTSMRDMKDAKSIKSALQRSKAELQKQEINATESRIAEERKAALASLGFAIAGAVASAVMGSRGPGSLLGSMSSGAATVVTKLGDVWNANMGPQAEADYHQIREKVTQQQESLLDMAIEESKGSYDDAKELFKLALRIMSEHAERQSQVVDGITRG